MKADRVNCQEHCDDDININENAEVNTLTFGWYVMGSGSVTSIFLMRVVMPVVRCCMPMPNSMPEIQAL